MEWVIQKEHEGMLIRDFLQDIHSFSRRIVVAIKFEGGKILVNDHPETVRFRLSAGDRLMIKFPKEKKGYYMSPEDMSLDVVYEDEAIIVINKQAGVATIPSPHQPTGTIANGLLGYYEKKGISYTVHVVTRLDRDTSGLLLIAKHRYSHSLLAQSQVNGQVKRSYKAIVEGQLNHKKGTINANIGRKEGSIIERAVIETGRKAITHYEMIFEVPNYSFVNVKLETGRTHQIRVHFAHIGHPLMGDDLYGGTQNEMNRQALHCDYISFIHPTSKEEMSFSAKVPDDMQKIIVS